MKEYYRLVIDALKQSLSDIVASGDIDREVIVEVARKLEFEADRRVVNNLPIEELSELRNDLYWVTCNLFGYE